jgi:aquaporin Z
MTRGGNDHPKVLPRLSAAPSLRHHWPEYLIEAAALGLFMISAGVFTTVLEYPGSSVHQALPWPNLRRALVGVAMGSTAMGIIYSPWGRRSGAHMNPAVTLAFLSLGKIAPWDAFFYVGFQFAGGLAGVLLTALVLGPSFTEAPVNYVVTVPGPLGNATAFAGELVIAFIMMAMIVAVSNQATLARFTGLFAGLLIACFVTFEAPLSGFGMNPARTLASALPSGIRTALWIYFIAAPLGMVLAAQGYRRMKRLNATLVCGKLNHRSNHPCIFCGAQTTVTPR